MSIYEYSAGVAKSFASEEGLLIVSPESQILSPYIVKRWF